MDDPWGSPWTSSAGHSSSSSHGNGNGSGSRGGSGNGDSTANGVSETLKPPQAAVLAGGLSGSTPFASLPETSPWADDDDGGFGGFDDDNAFGDWTTATTTDADAKRHTGGHVGGAPTPDASGWGAFAAAETAGFGFENEFENGFGSSQHLSPPRKEKSTYGGLGQLSPIAWPGSAALSPSGSPGGSPRRRRALSRSSVNSLGGRKGSISGFSRSPSVDPWSTVLTNEKRGEADQRQDYARGRASSTLSIPVLRLDDSNSVGKSLGQDEVNTKDDVATEAATDGVPQIIAQHVDSEGTGGSSDDDTDDTPKPPPQPTFPSLDSCSRPSTSSSDGSSHHHHADNDDPHQDSPTTSVEDDDATATNTNKVTTTPSPDVVQRKSSSKVQGLVELYDGLSTRPAATQSLSASASTRDSSRRGSIGSDKSVDGTETSDGEALETMPNMALAVETSESVPESPASDLTLPVSDSKSKEDDIDDEENTESLEDSSKADHEVTSKASPEEGKGESVEKPPESTQVDTDKRPNEGGKKLVPEATAPDADALSANRLLALFGKQPFTIDQAQVDELYNDKDAKVRPRDEKDAEENAPPLDAFIPDYILDDSFTSISERKVWYRIARHGSYRKHAAGGDDNENYRPVTWRTSAIRDDTVKIVRRWMEEDSFTGKPTLGGGFGRGVGGAAGGGARSGNLFGWDSAAEPVALDEVFKRKKTAPNGGAGHKYNLSSASSAWANEGSGASAGSPAGISPAFSPAPVFGWGSNSNSNSNSHDHVHAQPEPARNSVQIDRPFPVAAVPSPATAQPSRFSVVLPPRDLAPTLPPSTEKKDTGAFAGDDDDDDDDDWGEMVSSPVKEEFSIPPLAAPVSLPPAPVPTAPAVTPAPPKPSSPIPAPQLDDRAVAALAGSIIRGLPDLSYMAL
ncbi:hypothetical protein SPBR_02332 [Sporothrix brasiliensis 5110]|uniref:Uncharacterized protein n=1 Tax=Sporothrix brasiliensis 5110 TaxID=1398154 RepID=A0A0C2J5P3_9PEZI|nr:uncharacterized protein SPBR_02332 [Sporothrix brasiliensis 5110]KIH92372.1 hypothetical protein SPBR_02332 [Sporothrix brasiliensis 5110]